MVKYAPLVVRRVAPADRSEWLRIRRLLWLNARPDDLRREMDTIMQNLLTPVFVSERQSGDLCGFLDAGTRPYADGCDTGPIGCIEGWYVDEDMRGKGIGRALVAEAEGWVRDQGLREMASDTAISNRLGFKAHTALGYQEMEHLIHFRRNL